MKICKGIVILAGRGEKTRVGPGWVQGTGVCAVGTEGRALSSAQLCAFLHVASSSAAAAENPRGTDLRDAEHPGGGTTRRPPSDLARRGWLGLRAPRALRGRAGGAQGAGRSPAARARCRAVPGAGAVVGGGTRRHLHSVRDQQAAVDHHLRKEIQLERRSHAGLRGRRGGRREDAAGRGGSHNCAGRRSGRHRCGGLPAAAASPGSCHISLPLSVFSANPLRNRLLRQLSVERQVLSGEAEPSPRCGSPLTPAPPPPRERPIAAAGPGAARPGLRRSARPAPGASEPAWDQPGPGGAQPEGAGPARLRGCGTGPA